MGTIGLVSAALALAFLAGVNIFTRDSNIWSRPTSSPSAPPPLRSPRRSACGRSCSPSAAVRRRRTRHLAGRSRIIGLMVLLAAGAEWMAQAWSERASADSAHNSEVRSRIANPFEFPLAGAIAIGIIVYSFSRIMLWLSKTNTVLAFGVLALIILAFAFLFAYRPSIKPRAVGEHHRRRCRRARRRRRLCRHRRRARDPPARNHRGAGRRGRLRSPEEIEADEKASQSVAAIATVAAGSSSTRPAR